MIRLDNKSLENFIMFNLGKEDNFFTEKELKRIKNLDLNPIDIDGKYYHINMEILKYFPNLKELTISNMHVDIASFAFILRLENLENLTFISCTFQEMGVFSNLKINHIGFINSEIEQISLINRIKNLKELTLIGYKEVDLSYFINLNLTSLELSNTIIKKIEDLKDFINLNKLTLINTNVMNLGFLSNFSKLKELTITDVLYLTNKQVIDGLIKNKVSVYFDNGYLINKGEK